MDTNEFIILNNFKISIEKIGKMLSKKKTFVFIHPEMLQIN